MAKNTITVSRVLIDNSGMVVWLRIGQFSSSCAMNVEWFPFDEQTCDMTFLPMYDADAVTIKPFEKSLATHERMKNDSRVEGQKSFDEEDGEDEMPKSVTNREYTYDGEWKILGKLYTYTHCKYTSK